MTTSFRESLSFRIRELQKHDLPALEWDGVYQRYRRLYQLAWREAVRGRNLLLVAEVEQTIVGQIFVQLNGHPADPLLKEHTGYLYSFRVKPAFRNQGIGTKLVWTAEQRLLEQGFTRVIISVARDNFHAQRLYKRLGFTHLIDDPGQWFYIDDRGQLRFVDEPAYLFHKDL